MQAVLRKRNNNVRKIVPCGVILSASLFILFAAGLFQPRCQTRSDDEIRFGSRPYVPPSATAIHVQTNAVQVPVVVRDSQGKAVAGLKQSDFQLFDNGHPVQIASFAIEHALPQPVQYVQAPEVVEASLPPLVPPVNPPPPTPRYVALFFDDISLRLGDAAAIRKAAESFVKASLKPGDRIGIFTTSTTVQLNFTDDVPRILETLAQLLSRRKVATGGSQACQMNPYQASLVLQFYNEHSDALDLAGFEHCGTEIQARINNARNILGQAEQSAQDTLGVMSDVIRYLGRMPGQRVLVLASSGFLTQTLSEKQDTLINQALNANVIINSLDAKGLVADLPGVDEDGHPMDLPGPWSVIFDQIKSANREVQNDPLAVLAEGTGGHFYHDRNDLDVGLKEMATAPDVSYVLTFYPASLKRNSASHTLKVKLPELRTMNVSARRGYVAPSPNLSDSEKKKGRLDIAALAGDIQNAIPAQVMTDVVRSATGELTLKVSIHIDANKLPFQSQGDRRVERLIFITALFDLQDHFVTGVQGIMDLRLKDETMATVSGQGLDANLSVQAPPGNYRMRQVIQEVSDGRIMAINRAVDMK